MVGRVKTYEAIIKGENISEPGIPESFKVLLKELQSLALDVTVLDENGEEVRMTETVDYGDEELAPLIESDENFTFEDERADAAGFTTGTPDELEDGGAELYEDGEDDLGFFEDSEMMETFDDSEDFD